MRTVRIERYDDEQAAGFAGLIEGTTDHGKSWIMFLDSDGMPAAYWPEREASGAVVGPVIDLRRVE